MGSRFYLAEDQVYRCEPWDRFDWLTYGFGTRPTPLPTNLPPLATLKQTHSATVVVANDRSGVLAEGDALVASRPGTVVGVRTADCVPILLIDPEARVVAAVHAGWRGTVAGVASETVERMKELGANPARMEAAIGPAIGMCCFEVGPEVSEQFDKLFPERLDLGQRTRLNLLEANRRLLTAAGIPELQVYVTEECTVCSPELLHSFRRDREQSGRQTSWIGVRAGEGFDRQ